MLMQNLGDQTKSIMVFSKEGYCVLFGFKVQNLAQNSPKYEMSEGVLM